MRAPAAGRLGHSPICNILDVCAQQIDDDITQNRSAKFTRRCTLHLHGECSRVNAGDRDVYPPPRIPLELHDIARRTKSLSDYLVDEYVIRLYYIHPSIRVGTFALFFHILLKRIYA